MIVAVARFDLRIPGCRSLKEKRHVVKTLTAAIRRRFEISVAEVDHHDLWQRTAIAVAVVGAEQHHLRRIVQQVQTMVEGWVDVDVIEVDVELLWPEG